MALILSHPFRLRPNGAVALVEQQSEAGEAEQLAVLVMTRRGERPLVPGFGLTDPAFGGFSPGELAAEVTIYGPPVRLADVAVRDESDTAQAVLITFD